MKHFIIKMDYTVPIDVIDEHLHTHRSFLDEGYKKELLLASGPQNPREGGILIGKAGSLEEMKEFFTRDPFNQKNLATYTFIEFIPVKYQQQFKSWFVEDLLSY